MSSWKEHELNTVRNGYFAGLSNAQIASAVGRSEAAVRGIQQRLGLIPKRVVDGIEVSGCGPVSVPPKPPACPLKEAAKQAPLEFGQIPLDVVQAGNWTRFGLVADTHLCSHHERLDALHALYNTFEVEGITQVLHAGNIIDGYLPRINGGSVYESCVDGQAAYVARNYPKKEGIKTFFITGDDHESWFGRDGFNVGAYIQLVCEREGRTDLQYIGHVEADCEIRCGEHSQIIKVQHPGGGSAYSRSYTGQKSVESFQGGEKPAILIQGHYHVSNYMFDRNIHVISMPGLQDQTIFARKKRLRMDVGGAILEFKMNPLTGAITRLRLEWFMFFDRGFYKPFLKSDPSLLEQKHIIFQG
jgi:hypothetical protein